MLLNLVSFFLDHIMLLYFKRVGESKGANHEMS